MIQSEHSASTQDRQDYLSKTGTSTNTRVFGVLLLFSQIAIGLLYGFLVKIPERTILDATSNFSDFSAIFLNFATYFLVIVGFGLLFAYERRLVWSAIGFNLLIVCISVEWYFLYNFFWTKVGILIPGRGFENGLTFNNMFIWEKDVSLTTVLTDPVLVPYGATLSLAIKAGLANCVAFSSVLGKAGPLEAFLLSFIGTFGFELNRAVINRLDIDFGYTYSIFAYGGFMGLFLGLMLACKYKGQRTTARHPWYIGNSFSGAISLFGASIIYSLFPILAMDPNVSYRLFSTHATYVVPQSVWYTISASVLVSLAGSVLIHSKPIARDLINGVVAGGVCALSSGFYLTNPVWSTTLGCAAGFVQMIGQSLIETSWSKRKNIINTYSFTTFGAQAILGGIWGAIFRAVIEDQTRRQGFSYLLVLLPAAGYNLLIAVIAAGIGIVFGVFIGLLMLIAGKHQRFEHFHDYTYWVPNDGIRYPFAPTQYSSSAGSGSLGEYYVQQQNQNIKNRHGYL